MKRQLNDGEKFELYTHLSAHRADYEGLWPRDALEQVNRRVSLTRGPLTDGNLRGAFEAVGIKLRTTTKTITPLNERLFSLEQIDNAIASNPLSSLVSELDHHIEEVAAVVNTNGKLLTHTRKDAAEVKAEVKRLSDNLDALWRIVSEKLELPMPSSNGVAT